MQTVGHLLRERRQSLGLSLAEVAERIGVARSYLSMIENHRVSNPPSAGLLEALEHWLAVIIHGARARSLQEHLDQEPVKRVK